MYAMMYPVISFSKKVSFELGFVLRKDYERSVFYVRGQKFYLSINLVE